MNLENEYVKKFYNTTAEEFSNTRYRPWSCVESFLDNINSNSKIGDIGCGNGKNMNYRKDCEFYGCDFSESLINICKDKGLNVKVGDILKYHSNEIFDYTICIAVVNHENEKTKAIEELIRVTKKWKNINISVGFRTRKRFKRKFSRQEDLVDWKDKKQIY